jgi:hypothetical protein
VQEFFDTETKTEVKVISFPFVRDVLHRDHIDYWDNAILD